MSKAFRIPPAYIKDIPQTLERYPEVMSALEAAVNWSQAGDRARAKVWLQRILFPREAEFIRYSVLHVKDLLPALEERQDVSPEAKEMLARLTEKAAPLLGVVQEIRDEWIGYENRIAGIIPTTSVRLRDGGGKPVPIMRVDFYTEEGKILTIRDNIPSLIEDGANMLVATARGLEEVQRSGVQFDRALIQGVTESLTKAKKAIESAKRTLRIPLGQPRKRNVQRKSAV